MRLLWLLHLSALSFIPYAKSSDSQHVLSGKVSIANRTLIDALNDDPDYTSLLKLLQQALLIPTINRLNGSTLFAPTNDAIDKHSKSNALWAEALDDAWNANVVRDNVQEKLRQELFYHLLNYSIPSLPNEDNPQTHKTLMFPRKPEEPPSHEPPPNPPWLPERGGTLGGEPQRVRIASSESKMKVGTDAFGKGGAAIIKGQTDGGNGMLFGISDVLEAPLDLSSVVSNHPSLTYLNKIMTPEVRALLNSTSELTLFLPVDSAWNALSELELKYLESKFAADDMLRIMNMHAVAAQGVHWADSFEPSLKLDTISGDSLEISIEPESEKIFISSAELVEPDIYASNGVLHTISSLLIPPGSFNPTPEMYLLGLNCTSFVSMLHSVDLEGLINNTNNEYTILAPADDVLKFFTSSDDKPEDSEELKRTLAYHFLPGKWTEKKLKNRMLVPTLLEEAGLSGGKQVLDIEVGETDDKHKKEKPIRFGGASVLGDFYDANNTLIYLISRPLVPPSDALTAALPSLELSSFLAAVFSSNLAGPLKEKPRTTFLIPENDGFKRLGRLVSSHLLAASSKADLESVILHHIIDDVEYASDLVNGSQKSFATLEGTDIHVMRAENGSVSISASGGWAGMGADVTPVNLLTKTGVVHELSDVLLPRSLNLTIGKLMKAARGSTMANLVVRAGLEWILNGTAPPEDSRWADQGVDQAGWTLLCPTDEAFKGYNLPMLYNNSDRLQDIMEQHIIPVPKSHAIHLSVLDAVQSNRPIMMDDGASYTTLHSRESAYGDITFRQTGPDDKSDTGYLVGVKNARGSEGLKEQAHVLAWGRTTMSGGVGGVIQIDAVLMPYHPGWWIEYGAPIGAGIVGVFVICIFFLGVRAFWRRDTSEATYEPAGGFTNEDEEEQ